MSSEQAPPGDGGKAGAPARPGTPPAAPRVTPPVGSIGLSPLEPPGGGASALARATLAGFTKALLQNMDKATYYGANHPAHHALGDELYAELGKLLENGQVGYILQRGLEPEILVDGLPGGRVTLRELLPQGQYDLFVPRFVEYFDRYDMVMLAFRQGLRREEFDRFVGIMIQPRRPGDRHSDLSKEVIEAGITGITVLCSEDVTADQDLPWQVRICVSRLRRDLRAVPVFAHLSRDEIRAVKQQIFADVVRPVSQPEQLKLLVGYAPRIERELANVEGLEQVEIARPLVSALAPPKLCALTVALASEGDRLGEGATMPAEALTTSMLLCRQRLVDEATPGREEALRKLFEIGMVDFDELPEPLQDRLYADELKQRQDQGLLGQPREPSPRDIRILALVARLQADGERWELAAAAVRVLHAIEGAGGPAAATVPLAVRGIFSDDELGEITARLDLLSWREAEPIAQLLGALGARGAEALAVRVAQSGQGARFGHVYRALDEIPAHAPAAVADVLAWPNLSTAALRVLLALAARHPSRRAAEAAQSYLSHGEARVRVAALAAVAGLGDERAAAVVRRALDDPSGEVVGFALGALAQRFGDEAAARRRALQILDEVTPTTADDLLTAAVDLLARFPGAGAEREASLGALRRFAATQQRQGVFGIGRRTFHTPAVSAAEAALDRLLQGRRDEPSGDDWKSQLRDLLSRDLFKP